MSHGVWAPIVVALVVVATPAVLVAPAAGAAVPGPAAPGSTAAQADDAVDLTGGLARPDGSPAAGLRVRAVNVSTETGVSAPVDADGRFSLDVQPDRTYGVGYEQDAGETRYPLDGTPDLGLVDVVAVGTNDVDLGTRTLPDPHRLNVTVVDDSGAPVEDAGVNLIKRRDGQFAGSVANRTDAAGRFVLGGTVGAEVSGTVRIDVDSPANSTLGGNRTTVTVTADREVRVTLPRVATVSGRVVDPSGAPRAGESVVALDVASDEFDAFERTNATGAFALSVPGNDTYSVAFGDRDDDGLFPRNGVPDIYELDDVTPAGDVDLGTVTVPDGHVLDVRVVDENGTGVANATVEVRSTRGPDPRGVGLVTRTDADGFVRLDGRSYTGVEMAGPVAVEANATTANGSFATTVVSRNLTVEANRTVTVTVERNASRPAPPDVTGDGNPATDPDDDGRYEDVNGDGAVTPGDATVLFNAVFDGNAAVRDNPALFDFNGDGSITPGDATVLFEEAF